MIKFSRGKSLLDNTNETCTVSENTIDALKMRNLSFFQYYDSNIVLFLIAIVLYCIEILENIDTICYCTLDASIFFFPLSKMYI